MIMLQSPRHCQCELRTSETDNVYAILKQAPPHAMHNLVDDELTPILISRTSKKRTDNQPKDNDKPAA